MSSEATNWPQKILRVVFLEDGSGVPQISCALEQPQIRRCRTTPNLKARKVVPLFWPPCPPVRQGLFPCSAVLFLKNSHRAGPVLQEFGLALRLAGV